MHISLDWIKQYTQIKLDNDQLISKVRAQIGEVENIIDYSEKYKGVLVAKIKQKKDHPDAEKLSVYDLDLGSDITVQVVAGDKTLEIGEVVAYFPPETKVPYNAKPEKFDGIVKKVTLRGVESNGMLASARELDLGPDHSIVMRLNVDAKPGSTLLDAFDFDDLVIDIENKALANRADCFGVLGIAREIAGIQGIKFSSPDWYIEADKQIIKDVKTTLPVKINNLGAELCPRYMAASISNIQIHESPAWLRSLLIKSGLRPINNVVDITNYLMLLTGQPLHAFDYDKLRSKDPKSGEEASITIRTAKEDETITTLDGKTHQLDEKILLICDSTNPIAVAGVMGGLETEIDQNSKNIIIECAVFDKYNIRKTSMKLGLFTEAVTRFTKGQDPEKSEPVLYKAIELIKELASGNMASEPADSYLSPATKVDIEVSIDRLNKHLGTQLEESQIISILDNVELYSRPLKPGWIVVDAPSYRADLKIREDIHEEVGRLYGYNNITQTLPTRTIKPVERNGKVALQREIRNIMTSLGGNEIITYNFQGLDLFEKYQLNPEVAYHIRNPLSPDLEYMRTALLPSVYEKLPQNILDGQKEVALFEINKTHSKLENDDENLPLERTSLAFSIGVEEKKSLESYAGSPYYTAKIYLENLLKRLKLDQLEYKLVADIKIEDLPLWIKNIVNMYDPNASAIVTHRIGENKKALGILGKVSPEIESKCKLPKYCSGFEISIDELLAMYTNNSLYIEPSKYPEITNDICFVVDKDLPYIHIKELIEKEIVEDKMIVGVSAVDIYQTEQQVKEGLKQITYRIKLQSKVRTLTGNEAGEMFKKISTAVLKDTGGKLLE